MLDDAGEDLLRLVIKQRDQTIAELSKDVRVMEADYDALIARINSIYELMRCRETKSGRHQWRVSPLDRSADGWCKRCGVMAQTIVETVQVAEGLCPIGPPPAALADKEASG